MVHLFQRKIRNLEKMTKGDEEFAPSLPYQIRDFIFDLYQAVRVAGDAEEVSRLYEVKCKEVTDTYFSQSTWPDAKSFASDVKNDELFLALYREMTIRHVTVKLKPQLNDHLNSWSNYKKVRTETVNFLFCFSYLIFQ